MPPGGWDVAIWRPGARRDWLRRHAVESRRRCGGSRIRDPSTREPALAHKWSLVVAVAFVIGAMNAPAALGVGPVNGDNALVVRGEYYLPSPGSP